MKTPREVLSNRYRDVEPRLDAIRQEIVQTLGEPVNKTTSREVIDVGFLARCWQELFVPCRRYWMGLGIAWAVVAVFTGAGVLTDGNGRQIARTTDSAVEAMQAQLQLRNELLGVVVIGEARAIRPDPGPRSRVIREERYV